MEELGQASSRTLGTMSRRERRSKASLVWGVEDVGTAGIDRLKCLDGSWGSLKPTMTGYCWREETRLQDLKKVSRRRLDQCRGSVKQVFRSLG